MSAAASEAAVNRVAEKRFASRPEDVAERIEAIKATRDWQVSRARRLGLPTLPLVMAAWESEVRVLGLDLHGLGGAA